MKEPSDVGKTWGEIKAPARDTAITFFRLGARPHIIIILPRRPTGVHNQSFSVSPVLILVYVNDVGSTLHCGKLIHQAYQRWWYNSLFHWQVRVQLETENLWRFKKNLVRLFSHTNLTENSSKSNFIHFSLHSVDAECGLTVMLADTTLEEVQGVFVKTPRNSSWSRVDLGWPYWLSLSQINLRHLCYE